MRYQPQGLIRRNPESRIAKAAQALLLANSQINIVSGVPLRSSGATERLATPAGLARQFRKNGYVQTEVLPAIGTQTFVEFWYGYPSADIYAKGVSQFDTNDPGFLTGSSANQLGIFQAVGTRYGTPSTQWGCVYNWNAGNAGAFNLSGETLTPGVLTLLVVVRRQSGVELWRDGRLINFIAQSPMSYPAESLICGAFVEDTSYWPSSNDTIFAGRSLIDPTAEELRQLGRNPWSLIQAPDDDDYVASAGGIGATASPGGISAVATIGAVQASGGAKASPAGVGAVATAGTAQAYGGSKVTPTGIGAAASVGTAAASGGATVTSAGVTATTSVGLATATGAGFGTAYPAGVLASASIGVASASAGATINVVGVAAASSIGTATASGAAAGAAIPAGVSAAAQVGMATGSAGANVAPGGVSATTAVGTAMASGAGAGAAMPAGVFATGSVGTTQATAGAKAAPAGVAAASAVGSVTASGATVVAGAAVPDGVSAAAAVGQPSVSAGAGAAPGGISANTALGQVIASGTIIIGTTGRPVGVAAFGRVGAVVATGVIAINYVRSPAGAGFTPQQREQVARPAQVGSTRPANTQGSTR